MAMEDILDESMPHKLSRTATPAATAAAAGGVTFSGSVTHVNLHAARWRHSKHLRTDPLHLLCGRRIASICAVLSALLLVY
jgi:hypothetical protein